MKKSRSEQETIIRRAADEKSWDVFSEDPKVVREITRKFGEGIPSGGGWRWILPPTGIQFRKPVVLSDSERQRRSQKLAEARARRAP